MKRSLVVVSCLALALVACRDESEPLSPADSAVPSLSQADQAGVIPGRFIVTLREGHSPSAVARDHGVTPDFVYSHALNGFAGEISEAARAGLLGDSRVALVEPDGIVTAHTTQTGATWGIDRIDQRSLPLSSTFSYTNTGAGVTAYVIDTGLRFDHVEFTGRTRSLIDAIDGGSAEDLCNGHGTHVSGTIGGTTYGVAKGVTIAAARVLDCSGSGTFSQVIAGVDAVTADHDPGELAVANMSLGGSPNTSLETAVKNMIRDGVATSVSAGNSNLNACSASPARIPSAMTIGASDITDRRASFSNVGNCVDWFAPGVGITSAWNTSPTATAILSGTSMSSPHTAGVAALFLEGNPGATPQMLRAALFANTTKNIITSARTANNDLLFTDY